MVEEPLVELDNATLRLQLRGVRSANGAGVRNQASAPLVGGRIERALWGSNIVALQDISLQIFSGDRVALIGHNGAGKTSLLRMLLGIYTPSEGRCLVRGRRAGLLSLNLGLSAEATLRENIRLALALYGLPFQEIEGKTPDILEFSELNHFADAPLHACSGGMKARLGFAIATSVSPDIFLVDEAIGAGDARFALKARERIDSIFEQTRVLILSSHSYSMLKQFCTKAIWLEKGRLKAFGPLAEVYRAFVG